MQNNWQTRNTLLERAKDPNDQQAWSDFAEFYTPFIHIILRKTGVDSKNFDDVTQDILVKVWKYLKSFDKETHRVNFRTWLGTVIRRSAYDFFKKTSKSSELVDPNQQLLQLNSTNFRANELDEIIVKEWESYLVERALENVRKIFSGIAVEVFELSLEGLKSSEIAARLNLNEDSARTLKNRVKNRLIEEIKHLRSYLES
jgi:RNA polymerase sigma factor (sigma-70 family)